MNRNVPLTPRQLNESAAAIARLKKKIESPGFHKGEVDQILLEELGLLHSAHGPDAEVLKAKLRKAREFLSIGDRESAARSLAA